MYYKKVLIKERLPEVGKWVTTIDVAGEHRVYRVGADGNWNMREPDGINSPNNNLEMVYWLEETTAKEMDVNFVKAAKWDALDAKIAKCYFDEKGDELSPEDLEGTDLCTIGEMAASAFGYL